MPDRWMKGWMTFSEAAKKYNVDSSTLRKAVAAKRFHEDEYRLVGKTYIVKVSALDRLYGNKDKGSIQDRVNQALERRRSAEPLTKTQKTKGRER